MTHVPLARTFQPFDTRQEIDPDVAAYLAWDGSGIGAMSWDELLKDRRVVVLGEAGIGKTTEFRYQAERLNKQGHTAFFLRIERLLQQGSLSEPFETDADAACFKKWRSLPGESFFFLDSVDEARLNDPSALDTALRRLRSILGPHVGRIRLFLSCRASDWRYLEDRKQLDQLFSLPPSTVSTEGAGNPTASGKDEAMGVRVVKMQGLNSEQVSELARACGLDEPQPFIAEIAKTGAWAFVQRPQDVLWLVPYWRQERRIGTLSELVESDVQNKLQEENVSRNTRDELSPAEAREGAETLAAALVLCGKSAILLPGSGDPHADASALDARGVLPRWKAPPRVALLTRAIFDEATYGRVRIHHRTVREYLAACWLLQRFEARRRSTTGLLRLCVRKSAGGAVILRPMRGVLGWMATRDERLRERLIDLEPELLLQEGDPAALPPASRQRILQRLVERYSDRTRASVHPDGTMLRRFVAEELAPAILRLMEAAPRTEDVRELLLKMVAVGKLKICASLALEWALAENETEHVREMAIRAVAECGIAEHCTRLVAWGLQARDLPPWLIEALLDNLFPAWLNVEGCAQLLQGIALPEGTLRPGRVALLERWLADRCPNEDLEKFLEALLTVRASRGDTSEYDWVSGAIAYTMALVLNTFPARALPLNLLERAFKVRETRTQSRENSTRRAMELNAALKGRIEVRKRLFWSCVRAPPPGINLWLLRHRLCVDEADIPWLIEGAVTETSEQTREVALSTAIRLWWESNPTPEKREELLRLASGSHDVRAYLQQKTQPRPPTPHDVQREQVEEEQRRSRDDWRARMLASIDELASGSDVDALADLNFIIAASVSKLESRDYTQSRWELLAKEYGQEIAEAARIGSKHFWRTWTPPPPAQLAFEDEKRLRVGLSGLRTEVDEGLDFSRLSETERVLAARYALCEFLTLPRWFGELARVDPTAVETAVTEAVVMEFHPKAREPAGRSLLVKLDGAPAPVMAVTTRLLQEQLERDEPRRKQVLEDALWFLRHSLHTDRARLASLTHNALLRLAGHEDADLLPWLATYLYADGIAAWDFLEYWLRQAPDEETAAERLLLLAALLDRYQAQQKPVCSPSFQEPSTLRRMIQTLYRYHPPGHKGFPEALAPDTLQQAARFRDSLCRTLAEAAGDEAQRALVLLAEEPSLAPHRDYFLNLAELQAQGPAHFKVWSLKEFSDFTTEQWKRVFELRVFLSYRRATGSEITERIREWLNRELGQDNVFKDDQSIPWGADFEVEIESRLRESSALMLIIDEQWVTTRLEDPTDFVRREVEFALQHQVPLLPVLVREAQIPRKEQLPASLRPLCRLQTRRVRPAPDFHRDMEQLLAAIEDSALRTLPG
jgi:hypothetical protein